MKTLDELRLAVEKLQADIKELEAWEEANKEWRKVGGTYYSVSSAARECLYENDRADLAYAETGNCFRTREEAETELEVRKIIHKLRTSPGRVEQTRDRQWTIDVDEVSRIITHTYRSVTNGVLGMRWNSQESAQNAINLVGFANIIKAAKWLART